jgi:ribonuclease BN (tRNA processing enzyme)
MKGKNTEQTFLRIVKKVPDWKIRAYEIEKALRAYNTVKEQLVQELGEAGYNQLEAKTAHELAEELVARARGEATYTLVKTGEIISFD